MESSTSGCCLASAWHFNNFSLTLLIKVLLIKKSVYIKQNIVIAMLRKANAHSVDICKLIKKINNVKEDPGRKTDLNFDFSQTLIFMIL